MSDIIELSKQEIERLGELIVEKLRIEFQDKHLSGNLANTIEIVRVSEDKIQVQIPAETYNMYQWFAHKVVVHNGRGSYASKLDETGSEFMVYDKSGRHFAQPHNHKGYVDKAIKEAVQEWMANLTDLKAKVISY